MTPAHITALLTMVGLALLLLFGERPQSTRARIIIKGPTSALFIATAVLSGCLETSWGTLVLAGLVLSWLGDVLLIGQNRAAFLAGLVAFLLGHVAYGAAFVERGLDLAGGALPTLGVALIPAALVGRWLLPKVDQKMKLAVLAYMVVITIMVALAGGTVAAHGRPLLLLGAIVFWLSDVSVATDRFAGGTFTNRVWGLSFYYGGQLLLALSSGPN